MSHSALYKSLFDSRPFQMKTKSKAEQGGKLLLLLFCLFICLLLGYITVIGFT